MSTHGGLHDEILIDAPWLLMTWDGSHRCVIAVWKGFATYSEFTGAWMRALETVVGRKADAMVHDARKLESVTDEDRRWLRETWAPLAAGAGVTRLAAVVAPSHWGYHEPMLDWRISTSMGDALEWISSEPSEHGGGGPQAQ